MDKTFTPEQSQAIAFRGQEVLVSAAAGSGKTAVLTQRIIGLITETNHPRNINDLLVVTFTEAAASEMKARISKAMVALVTQNPHNQNLRRQLHLLKKAPITTIHAFCRKVVRESFHVLDIDPNFKIADPTEIELLKEDIIKETFDAYYDKGGLFLDLVEMYGDKYTDGGLRTVVFELYQFALKSADPVGWLQEKLEFGSPWYAMTQAYVTGILDHATDALAYAMVLANEPLGPAKYIENLEADQAHIEDIRRALGDLTQLEAVLGEGFTRLKTISKKEEVDPELKEQVKAIRETDIKKPIQNLLKEIPFGHDMVGDLQHMAPYMAELVAVTLHFHEAFMAIKKEKNLLFFDDLEHCAIAALKQPEIRALQMYEEVLIDEYQDSNEIQEFILSGVAKTRFMVGDIKQSIYKFRGTGPELFLGKYQTGQVIPLSTNFRSGRAVIEGVNQIFSRLIPSSGVSYGEDAKLYLREGYEGTDYGTDIEILLLEGTSDLQREAQVIGDRILALQKAHGLRLSDMAIITRSRKGTVEVIIDALTKWGIGAQGESETGFFETVEIRTLVSLLHVIDNPLQDIHVAAVLASAIYDVTADELLTIRETEGERFYEALRAYVLQKKDTPLTRKLERFLADLSHFRAQARQMDVGRFLSDVLDHTQYILYMAAGPEGQLVQDNIHLFLEMAQRQKDMTFYAFARYIEKLMNRQVALGEAKTSSQQDAVKVMSIHKSKGLEFPVVFMAGMGKKLNKRDASKDLILHKDYGFAPKYIDLTQRMKHNTLANFALKQHILKEGMEEEVRVLYVAMTRAKEKLILVGSATDLEKKKAKWHNAGAVMGDYFSASAMGQMGTYLDMVMPCVLKYPTGFNITWGVGAEAQGMEETAPALVTQKVAPDLAELEAKLAQLDPVKTQERLAEITQAFTFSYANEDQLSLPASLNLSQIKGNYFKRLAEANLSTDLTKEEVAIKLELPTFTQATGLDKMVLGSAVHTVLEHLDIHTHEPHEVVAFLEGLTQQGILTETEQEAIDASALERYLASDLVKAMKTAKILKKELPFAMNLSPEQAYLPAASGEITIHGIIDCYYETDNNGLVLVDYKTDRPVGSKLAWHKQIKERYQIQMDMYKQALETITGKPVVKSVIYLLSVGEELVI